MILYHFIGRDRGYDIISSKKRICPIRHITSWEKGMPKNLEDYHYFRAMDLCNSLCKELSLVQILPSTPISSIFYSAHYQSIRPVSITTSSTMIRIVYGSPAAGSGNKRAALIGGRGRHLRPIVANWLYQLPTLPPRLSFSRVKLK
jgi:hypothetical protein